MPNHTKEQLETMGDGKSFNTAQLLFFLAVIALIVGIVFQVIYLVKDRSSETAQDVYNRENAKMFFLAAIALAIIAMLLAAKKEREM